MNYSAVKTKAQAIYARYVKNKSQLDLLAMGPGANLLSHINDIYGLKLEGRDLYELNKSIELINFRTLASLLYFLGGPERSFYRCLLTRYEINDIKRTFRTIVHREDMKALRSSLISLDPGFLDQEKEMDLASFIDILSETDPARDSNYGRRLLAYKDMEEDRVLFYIEMTLDQGYYEDLVGMAKEIKGKNSLRAQKLLGQHIDIINLLYIYRGKRTYNISPQELSNFLIRGGYKFSKDLLDRLAFGSLDYFEKVIGASHLSFLFSDIRETENVDIKVQRYLFGLFERGFLDTSSEIGKLICLPPLLEMTLRDISAVVEARGLGFSEGLIRSLLAVPPQRGEKWQ